MRMAQGRNRFSFTLKSLGKISGLNQIGFNDLNGNITLDIELARTVNRRHSPFSKKANDFVIAQALPDQTFHVYERPLISNVILRRTHLDCLLAWRKVRQSARLSYSVGRFIPDFDSTGYC